MQKQLKYKVATSFDSKKYFQCYQTSNHQTRVLCEAEYILVQENKQAIERSDSTPPETPTQQPLTLNRAQSEPGEEFDEDAEEETAAMVPDNQTLLRMLEENEKVRLHSYYGTNYHEQI